MSERVTVTELNTRVKELFGSTPGLKDIWVIGEISNFKLYTSGHSYFTIKDAGSEIRAVMFKSARSRIDFEPGDSQKIEAYGHLDMYVERGSYQFIVESMKRSGIGDLYLKYEALKTPNREFVAISRVLSSLNFTGAYFQGLHATGTTPYCEQALLKIAPETPYAELQPLQELTDTTLVTRFDSPGQPTHLMVVNCDYRKDRTLHIKAPSDAERFDALAGKWSTVGAAFDLSLVRGGGVLLRLP